MEEITETLREIRVKLYKMGLTNDTAELAQLLAELIDALIEAEGKR